MTRDELALFLTELLAGDARVAEVTELPDPAGQTVFLGLVLRDGTPVSVAANVTP